MPSMSEKKLSMVLFPRLSTFRNPEQDEKTNVAAADIDRRIFLFMLITF